MAILDLASMVLMALLWAGAYVSGKLSVAAVPSAIVAFLRFLLAGSAMLMLMLPRHATALKLSWRDLPLFLGLGASGIAGYNLFFFRGLQLTSASDGGMIIPTLSPLLTLLIAPLILGEPLTARKVTGAVISLIGQGLLFWTILQEAIQDGPRLLGDLYFVGSAICWSIYTILGRIAARRFSPMASTTLASLAGALLLLPAALWSLPGSSGYTAPFWGHMLYLALGSTVAGFFLWSRGLERLGASRASVFINLVPVFTLLLAALLLAERPTVTQVAGTLVVLSGVYLAGTLPSKRRQEPPEGESCRSVSK